MWRPLTSSCLVETQIEGDIVRQALAGGDLQGCFFVVAILQVVVATRAGKRLAQRGIALMRITPAGESQLRAETIKTFAVLELPCPAIDRILLVPVAGV